MNDQWPLALRVDAFKPEREGLRKAVQVALGGRQEGRPRARRRSRPSRPPSIDSGSSSRSSSRQTSPDYIPAHDTIKAMAGLTKMLYSPKVEEIIAELEDYQGTTLGDLLSFMQAFNLRFAPANSFRQRQHLLEALSDARRAGERTFAAQAAQAVGRTTAPAAEDWATKAVDGLKSAAVDFFKDMDWKHLSGKGKPSQP